MMGVAHCLFFASSFGLFCHFVLLVQNAVSILICSHWAWLLLVVQIMFDNFYLFKLCLNALICSHYVWLLLFVQIMFDYEFSACPVSHVCDQSCLSTVLRLMMVNSVAVDSCCGFVHCCLVTNVVQCCSVLSSVQSCSWWSIAVLCLICPWQSLYLPATVISAIVGKCENKKMHQNTIKRMFDHPSRLQGVK